MFYSLRSRLMLIFSILLIVPFTAVVFILSKESEMLIQSSIETSTLQTIDQFASHAGTLLTQIEDTGKQVLSSRITQDWITTGMNNESTPGELYFAKKQLRDFFSSYAVNNSNILSISTFRSESGGIWTQDRGYLDSNWYKQYRDYNVRWTQSHRDPDQSDESMRVSDVNSLVIPLVQLQSLSNVGLIKVNYPTNLLRDDIDKIRFGDSGKAFLLTENGLNVLNQNLKGNEEVLSEGMAYVKANLDGQTSGIFPLKQMDKEYLLFYRKLPVQNWMILGEVPKAELYATITQTKETLLYASLVLLIIVISVALWLSTGITKPLSAMARAMRQVKYGRFDLAIKDMPKTKAKARHNEVDYVTSVFEQMTHRLKYLIETEFETNLRRKNAEYKALLLQINPHFYNNTLEIISGLAAMKREDLVMDATEALAKMMRYSLKLDTDLVRVSEELGYIRDYLFILKLRHEDNLIVDISQDGAADSLHITKFILQPLVENAVKYSLEKGGTANIFLSSSLREGCLYLTVQDNGIGMPQELIQSVLADTELKGDVGILSDKGNSIGLRNVLSRCRLYYGDLFEVVLESEEGIGTAITLMLPLIRS